MRVALVHDWLTGTRGGEKVLLELVRLFPGATLFTLFHFPGSVPAEIERLPIVTTALQRIVSTDLDYRKLLPLFFLAAETWDVSGFDLVLSSSHCVAKNVKTGADAVHLCYAHTPVRYLHHQFEAYFGGRSGVVPALARAFRGPLAAWDVRTASRVDAFLANSENVRGRIRELYGRESRVVHPPVDLDFYRPPSGAASSRRGLLVVSALAPYKRIADAIEAAERLRWPLTIAGFGPEEERLKKQARGMVAFAGTPNDEELRDLYRSTEAVLMPGEEDFGIVPLEAQACGTPVVAWARGGATETVRDGETGVLYASPGVDGLVEALGRLRTLSLRPDDLTRNAARFSPERFRHNLTVAAAGALLERGRPDLAAALPGKTSLKGA